MAKIGRPTKCTENLLKRFDKLINKWQPKSEKKFFELCSIECVAYKLGLTRISIWTYTKENQAFFNILKRWETKRDSAFLNLIPKWKKNPALWIFLAKNFLGYSDKMGDYEKALDVIREAFRKELEKHPEVQQQVIEIITKAAQQKRINVPGINYSH